MYIFNSKILLIYIQTHASSNLVNVQKEFEGIFIGSENLETNQFDGQEDKMDG